MAAGPWEIGGTHLNEREMPTKVKIKGYRTILKVMAKAEEVGKETDP
jgi:hypothetical protein